jgi:excisionase family DNA binding protein
LFRIVIVLLQLFQAGEAERTCALARSVREKVNEYKLHSPRQQRRTCRLLRRDKRVLWHPEGQDLRDAINLLPPSRFAASLLQDPKSTPGLVQNSTIGTEENQRLGLERETGIEPATLSLGMRTGSSAASRTGWQTSEDRTIGDPNPDARSPGLAGFCTREAPIEPQGIARHVRSAEARQPGGQRPLRRPQLVSGAVAWLTVSDVAKQLRVSSATVYRLIDSGELRHGRVSNAIRISQADLAAFLRGDS